MNILVVDDDKMVLELLTELLQLSYPDLTVLAFSRSLAAKQKIEEDESEIRLVITDCDMPDITGFHIIEACIGRVPNVIMMSGVGSNLKRAEKRFGTTLNLQTLVKPARIQHVQNAIESALHIGGRS